MVVVILRIDFVKGLSSREGIVCLDSAFPVSCGVEFSRSRWSMVRARNNDEIHHSLTQHTGDVDSVLRIYTHIHLSNIHGTKLLCNITGFRALG
jgi:hypothetical protein